MLHNEDRKDELGTERKSQCGMKLWRAGGGVLLARAR